MRAARLSLLLALLDQARAVQDMDAPGLRLHRLKGDMDGFWAVTPTLLITLTTTE